MSELTEKQQRFVEAYCGSARGNATEAARIAGYKGDGDTLKVQGSRMLTNANVREAIDAMSGEVRSEAIADAAEVQAFLTDVMRGAMSHTELDMKGEPVQVSPPWKVRVTAGVELAKMRDHYAPTKQEVKHEGAAPAVSFVFEHNGRGPTPEHG